VDAEDRAGMALPAAAAAVKVRPDAGAAIFFGAGGIGRGKTEITKKETNLKRRDWPGCGEF